MTSKPGNLPIPLSSFIGRKRELAEVRQLLRAERLLTLTGAGGSGKTRLGLQAANDSRQAFEDGTWLVELAPLAAGALVPQAVASALEIREQPGRALMDTLAGELEPRQLLLVLDNCEHLVRDCAQLAEMLLQRCAALTILATSREPLGIGGEVIRIVPPLSLPASGEARPESDAVQLFVTRAQTAAPGFELTDDNAAAVAEICRRLDGMPLAIELAAARVRSLSTHQIAALMVDRFQLLTGGSRTAPARQRTLEATLDWSYALLSEAEKAVLQGLSVFAGGCSLEAAQAVCAGDGLGTGDVLDVLSHLVEKSLTSAENTGPEVRFHLLETVREYARRKLAEGPRAEVYQDRHLDYFVHWAHALQPTLLGPDLALGMSISRPEQDNVRAALDWSEKAAGKVEAGLRLATAAWNFWRVEGFHSEGRARLASLLAHKDAQAVTLPRGNALHCAALHAFYQSDYPACRTLAAEALGLFEQLGAAGRNGVADCLELEAEIASETGDYADAFRLYELALPIYRDVGDVTGEADTLKMLGYQSMRAGEFDRARIYLEQGLEMCRRSRDQRHISSALAGLGELAIRTGRFEDARRCFDESLKISRTTGEKWNLAINLGSLGWLALLQEDYAGMVTNLRESLSIRLETGDRSGAAWCLEKLARAAMLQSRFDTAARAFGAAAAARAPMGSKMDLADRSDYEADVEHLRTALGNEALQEAWQAGEHLPLGEAVELALSSVEVSAPATEREQKESAGGLTAREREVAALIARGKSNREIAEAMTVGVKTVETYVTRILGKLGFDSRVQVATWAVSRGIVASDVDG